jgi:HAE1 family hydrophobic/amphiphilic exporter-1
MRMFSNLTHRPVAVSMFYAALVVGGIFAFTRLPLELAPAKEFPRLSVVTTWGSTSPETVEQFITAPIEELANTVSGVRKVSSTSEEGRSTVDIEFEPKTDMNFARLELLEKLAAFAETLPPGATPPVLHRYVPKDLRDLQGFLSYSLVGDRPAHVLRKFAEESIAPALLTIKGIANVQTLGGEQREIQIEIDPARVAALGLRVEDINARLRELHYNAPLGTLESSARRILIAVRNRTLAIRDLEQLIVGRTPRGTPVRLSHIGMVRDGFAEPRSFYRINGKPTVSIIIDKEPHTHTLALADAVFEKLAALSKTFPPGFLLIKESDKSERMRRELGKLYQEIIVSLACIFIVLLLFLRNLKAPLLILSSILFSLAGTFLLFWLFGLGLHLLTLAGLVLGFGRLVDDSIVVLENINRHQFTNAADTSATIATAVSEIALPVVASTFTTVGALLPLSFLPQDLKPYFLDFGIAVGVSMFMSLLVSFTLIPTVSAHTKLQPLRISILETIGARALRAYQWLLHHVLRRRKITLAFTLWLFGLPVWLLPEKIESESLAASIYNQTLGSETYKTLKPYIDYVLGGTSHLFFAKVAKGEVWAFGEQTYLVVGVGFPQGTEIERYNQIALDVEKEVLRTEAGIQKVTTRVQPDYAVVRIDITEEAAQTALPFELKNRLVVFGAQTGGATISVSGFGPGFYRGGESAPSFYVKVLGYNYNRVREIAEQFRERIERNPRVAEVDIDRSFGRWNRMYELVILMNRDAIANHGLTVAEVVRAIRTYTRGALEYSQVVIEGERLPYSVKFVGYRDFSVDDLGNAIVVNARGEQVRVSDLIRFEERRVPAKITRENQQYLRFISFEYKGPYRFGDRFVDETIKAMPLPSGYLFDRSLGFFWLTETEQVSLVWVAALAFIVVFMVTASLYESFIKPFIVILSVPFSLMGLFLAFYLTDTPFGRGGYASVILLIGIVTTNSIVLVDYIAKHVTDRSNLELLVQAASVRLRPIVMTTLTTVGGLAPLLLLGAKDSIWYSLALGAIGGLVSSTLLTLFVIPVVYSLIVRTKTNALL